MVVNVALVRGDRLVLGGGGAGRDGTVQIDGISRRRSETQVTNTRQKDMRTSYGIGSVGLDLQRSRLYHDRTLTHSDLP